MTPEAAAAILAASAHSGHQPRSVADARPIVVAWLRAENLDEDRYGNFKPRGEATERWHLARTVLQKQTRIDGRWVNIGATAGLIAAAQNLTIKAAKTLSREDVLQAARGVKQARVAQRAHAASRREEQAQREKAHGEAWKVLASREPGLVADHVLGERIPDLDAQRLREDHAAEVVRILAGQVIPPDGDLVSARKPPMLPIASSLRYIWDETRGGVAYTVAVLPHERGVAQIQIGRVGEGFMRIDPLRMQPIVQHYDARGDAYVSGSIAVRGGVAIGRLFMIVAAAKRQGAGTRALSVWCDLMRGYGSDQWIAEAIGEEGALFLKALAERGVISIIGTRGADAVVECAGPSGLAGLAGAGLAIRSHTYRQRQGFLIYGTDPRGRSGQRVFCKTREGAEAVRDAMRRGDDREADRLLRTGA